ncbi:MAG: reverse transcriptase/maturase family protein [Acholeplasmataceae bacterium]|jgi:retron-type reverse transcriptase
MKRYGNLFSKIYDFDNLVDAHRNARKGKTHYSEVKMVDANPEKYITKIYDMLVNRTYHTSKYRTFTKIDKKKEREIFALPYYPDRIIQWAIVQVLEPIWMKTFVKGTYSSLKGRGIHKALQDVKHDLQDGHNTRYCLKFDIKKFYPSINHTILKAIIRKKIKDFEVLAILDEIIDSASGVPIGNYLSQYFGNLYLNGFDHWVKETKQMKYYYRYCDDVVILAPEKSTLHQLKKEIQDYLLSTLKLELKSNYQVFPTNIRGIDFVGYRMFSNHTLVRKSIATNMKKKLAPLRDMAELTQHDQNVIGSYHGWLKWGDTYRLSNKYILPLMVKPVIS